MADFRYKSLKSWKIDNIDLTQQFRLSIFTDFRYQSIKITDLIATDFCLLTTPGLCNWMTFWNSGPLERKYSVGIIYIGWVSVDTSNLASQKLTDGVKWLFLKKYFNNIVGQKLLGFLFSVWNTAVDLYLNLRRLFKLFLEAKFTGITFVCGLSLIKF